MKTIQYLDNEAKAQMPQYVLLLAAYYSYIWGHFSTEFSVIYYVLHLGSFLDRILYSTPYNLLQYEFKPYCDAEVGISRLLRNSV